MTAEALAPVVVTAPGVYTDLDETVYHRHPALSYSGAKKLLPPSAPAIYRYEQDNPPEPKDVFDFGSGAHRLILGVGPDLVEVEHDDWKTAAARLKRDEARAAGAIPLLSKDMRTVEAMAASLYRHPFARRLIDRRGTPEASLFWTDDETGVPLRARLDVLPDAQPDARLIIADLKTTACAHRDKFAADAYKYGYYIQAWNYRQGVTALGLDDDPAFLFIAVEKTPPFLVNVFEPDFAAYRHGEERMREAIRIYADCTAAEDWPGYSNDVELISVPRWAA